MVAVPALGKVIVVVALPVVVLPRATTVASVVWRVGTAPMFPPAALIVTAAWPTTAVEGHDKVSESNTGICCRLVYREITSWSEAPHAFNGCGPAAGSPGIAPES